ncbi:unnamed protein product [Arabidopsis lyrata]|nr:unnamed protein product [Arabidopsis lyrata]
MNIYQVFASGDDEDFASGDFADFASGTIHISPRVALRLCLGNNTHFTSGSTETLPREQYTFHLGIRLGSVPRADCVPRADWQTDWQGTRADWQTDWQGTRADWQTDWQGTRADWQTDWQGTRADWQTDWQGTRADWQGTRADWQTDWQGTRADWQTDWQGTRADWQTDWQGTRADWQTDWQGTRADWQTDWQGTRADWQTDWQGTRADWQTVWQGTRADWQTDWQGTRADWQTDWQGTRADWQTDWQGTRADWQTDWQGTRADWQTDWQDFSITVHIGLALPHCSIKFRFWFNGGERRSVRRQGLIESARFLSCVSSGHVMREPSMIVREVAAEQLEERQSDWAYFKPRHSRSLSATLQPRHSRSLLQTSSFFSFDSLPLLNSAADFGVDGGEVPFWCRLRSVEGAARVKVKPRKSFTLKATKATGIRRRHLSHLNIHGQCKKMSKLGWVISQEVSLSL